MYNAGIIQGTCCKADVAKPHHTRPLTDLRFFGVDQICSAPSAAPDVGERMNGKSVFPKFENESSTPVRSVLAVSIPGTWLAAPLNMLACARMCVCV